jgi:hypothetical protein
MSRHLLGTKMTLVQSLKSLSVGNVWRPLRDLNSCLLRERDNRAFLPVLQAPLKSLGFSYFSTDIACLSLKTDRIQSATNSNKFRQWAPIGHQINGSDETRKAYRFSLLKLKKSYTDTFKFTTRLDVPWGESWLDIREAG